MYLTKNKNDRIRMDASRLHMGVKYCEYSHSKESKAWFKQVFPAVGVHENLERKLDHGSANQTEFEDNEANERKTARHFGQRKLLISEIEFLTMHARVNDTVVYAGAAPGTHIDFLKSMFIDLRLKYVLIDPEFACVQEHRRPRGCVCVAERFELLGSRENSAEFWSGKGVLFISDVRTSTARRGDAPLQSDVESNMAMQMEWVKKMRPRAGMLKFKLPFDDRIVPYLKGEIFLPIWGRQRTAESRLIFTDHDAFSNNTLVEHTYSAKAYEKEMFYFNTVTRMSAYQWPKRGCRCYDCVAESLVLAQYFQRLHPKLNIRLIKEVDFLRDKITQSNPSQDPESCLTVCTYSSRSVARRT